MVRPVRGAPSAPLRELLAALDARHPLRDTVFAAPHRLERADDRRGVRLVAGRDGVLVGFLHGIPCTGHIALVGALVEGQGIGTALVEEFLRLAHAAGTVLASVVLDSEPGGRWRRRMFFEARGFVSTAGSALHFARPV